MELFFQYFLEINSELHNVVLNLLLQWTDLKSECEVFTEPCSAGSWLLIITAACDLSSPEERRRFCSECSSCKMTVLIMSCSLVEGGNDTFRISYQDNWNVSVRLIVSPWLQVLIPSD